MGPIGPSMQAHISSCPQCRLFFEVDEEAVDPPPTFIWGGVVVGRGEEEEEEGFEDMD
jgi:hypothetical protein